MCRRRRCWPTVGVATAAVAAAVTGCGSDSSGGLKSVSDRDVGGTSVARAQPADFTAYLDNDSGYSATLERVVSLIPLRGFRTPRLLRHGAVQTGREVAGAVRGWPPEGAGYKLRPLAGYHVPSGRQRVQILYSVAGERAGQYADRGVRVRVELHGHQVVVSLLRAAGICVFSPHDVGECSQAFQQRLGAAVSRQG